jgi:hypothetical protein
MTKQLLFFPERCNSRSNRNAKVARFLKEMLGLNLARHILVSPCRKADKPQSERSPEEAGLTGVMRGLKTSFGSGPLNINYVLAPPW